MEQMANPEQTKEQLQAQLDLDLLLYGVAYKWKVPDQAGGVMEEWRIPPACIIPGPRTTDQFPGGYYRIEPVLPDSGAVPPMEWEMPSRSIGTVVAAEWIERSETDEYKNRHKPFSQKEPI